MNESRRSFMRKVASITATSSLATFTGSKSAELTNDLSDKVGCRNRGEELLVFQYGYLKDNLSLEEGTRVVDVEYLRRNSDEGVVDRILDEELDEGLSVFEGEESEILWNEASEYGIAGHKNSAEWLNMREKDGEIYEIQIPQIVERNSLEFGDKYDTWNYHNKTVLELHREEISLNEIMDIKELIEGKRYEK